MFRGLAGGLVEVHGTCVDGCAGPDWLARCSLRLHARMAFTALMSVIDKRALRSMATGGIDKESCNSLMHDCLHHAMLHAERLR